MIEIGEILDKPIKEAVPRMKEICNDYNLDRASEGKQLCQIAQVLKDLLYFPQKERFDDNIKL